MENQSTIPTEIFLESWDRQCKILLNLASQVTTEALRSAKSSDKGMSIVEHLCHIHECRYGWLGKVSPKHQAQVGDVLQKSGENWLPITDFEEIKHQLSVSAQAIRDAVAEAIQDGKTRIPPYDHPVFFLQHMLWHEGYHFSLIRLALCKRGAEPSDAWEEKNVWALWRDEEIWEE